MTVNLTDEYIELTKKQITDYLRLVFENKFIRKYCDIYIITNILEKPLINMYTIDELDFLNKSINSIKFTDEGD